MPFIGRHFFARVGRFEVFAESWKRNEGEALIRTQKSSQGGFCTFQLWVPGVHLIVDLRGEPEVVAGN